MRGGTVAGGVLFLAAIGFILGLWAGGGVRLAAGFPAVGGAGRDQGIRLPPAGIRVATGLKCPCGCPDLLLACGCQNPKGSAEVRRYILELLANGRSEADARVELINRYGASIQRVGR